MKYFNIKDANGQIVVIDSNAIFEALASDDVTVLGFPVSAILEFKEYYDACAGKYPVTAQSVREVLMINRWRG